jgi:DNA-binding transcriptional MerR regulator
MAQWYVKDLSKLTKVSVQTLHHYDRIGLLTPSVRQANGYRLYSEKDLLKLQQIIALKFFGFELAQIKTLLGAEVAVLDHFAVQAQFLDEKAKTLIEASKALKGILSSCSRDKSIPWETIIKLIEVFRMTQELEKTWAGQVLTPEELKAYARFEQSLKARFNETEKEAYEKSWEALVREVDANLDQDPESALGQALGKRCMDWVNALYGKEFVRLRTAIWEKGFKQGHAAEEHQLSPRSVEWLDRAIDAYYRSRIYGVLAKVEMEPQAVVLKAWNELLAEMYGEEETLKKELVQSALTDAKVSQAARDWLKKKCS